MKYLSNSALKNICEKGSDEELKKYIEFYAEKREEVSSAIDIVVKHINTEKFQQILNDQFSDRAKDALFEIYAESRKEEILFKEYNSLNSRAEWYDKVLKDLEVALNG